MACRRPKILLLAHQADSDDVADYRLLSDCHQERNCRACDEPVNFNTGEADLWHDAAGQTYAQLNAKGRAP